MLAVPAKKAAPRCTAVTSAAVAFRDSMQAKREGNSTLKCLLRHGVLELGACAQGLAFSVLLLLLCPSSLLHPHHNPFPNAQD